MNGRIKRGLLDRHIPPLVMALLIAVPVLAGEEENRWCATQAFPKAVVRTTNQQQFPEPRVALQMMVQSVAGLAAKAVNEGRGDELVWVDNGEGDLEKWYARLLAEHPGLATPGTYEPWDLVDRNTKRGIIKGYILYRSDKSKGEKQRRPAGHELLRQHRHQPGRIVGRHHRGRGFGDGGESARPQAAAGCPRENTGVVLSNVPEPVQPPDAFAFKIRECPTSVTWPSRKRCSRPMAVTKPTGRQWHGWNRFSPILGWNCGDEFENTDLSTGFGEIQTASNWSLNLPVLMAGTEKSGPFKGHGFDPRTIDWKDSRSGRLLH